ncbi:uncharacterized protein MONBRDRAFT_38168 [Monosiga brevicollis MX1]|uniref:PH domain-containing protein n=1 Tax=Monosiga brevicollis TaxID=81824 RepID=A9V622_MONBE|nr:uncharacterized protein MONBRDRAFT_38168 [Monosiga brevicollis MX1]EDQ86910.1 predicted protein [Monosiga brevicollis MX1]|eukprot:XP_001748149.1 hypothetical protein [Monosiga brevicollis MX1]
MAEEFGFGGEEATGFGEEATGFGEEATGFGEDASAPAPVSSDAAAPATDNSESSAEATTVGHEEDIRAERSGWLVTIEPKKTLSRKGGNKERWFNLSEGTLTYAASVRADPIATIPIADITSVEEHPGQEDSFTLVMKKKSLFVKAREASEAQAWVASLRKAQKSSVTAGFGQNQSANALLF